MAPAWPIASLKSASTSTSCPSSRRRAMQAGAKRPSSFSDSEDCPQVRPSSQRGREMLSAAAPLQDIAGKQRRLGLWLTVAAHRAIDHHPAIVQARGGRVEGVEWLFARASARRCCGSRLKAAPRFCQTIPVSGITTPLPNS